MCVYTYYIRKYFELCVRDVCECYPLSVELYHLKYYAYACCVRQLPSVELQLFNNNSYIQSTVSPRRLQIGSACVLLIVKYVYDHMSQVLAALYM